MHIKLIVSRESIFEESKQRFIFDYKVMDIATQEGIDIDDLGQLLAKWRSDMEVVSFHEIGSSGIFGGQISCASNPPAIGEEIILG